MVCCYRCLYCSKFVCCTAGDRGMEGGHVGCLGLGLGCGVWCGGGGVGTCGAVHDAGDLVLREGV